MPEPLPEPTEEVISEVIQEPESEEFVPSDFGEAGLAAQAIRDLVSED